MVACNESGGISMEILVQFLKHMDKLNIFPRQDGLKPFLLLDGHGSRLELPFLKYVNDPGHPWVVCIGVPYGTSYWQVGDSSEQNGSYKMAISRAKKELVLKKQRQCFSSAKVETYEIINVVNAAWEKSFARIQYNKRAIAARGWNPLTRNLLDHPEIAASKENESEEEIDSEQRTSGDGTRSIATSLNFTTGLSNMVMVDILQNIDREAVRKQIRESQTEGQQAIDNLLQCKKLTAGAVFKSRRAYLGPDVLQVALDKKKEKDEGERKKKEKQESERRKKKEAYLKANAEVTNLDPSRWTVAQLKALVSYKRKKTDNWNLPSKRNQLVEKWEEIKNRETPPQTPEILRTENNLDDRSEDDASGIILNMAVV
jgi:hypothetical protein